MSIRFLLASLATFFIAFLIVCNDTPANSSDNAQSKARVDSKGRPQPEGAIARLGGDTERQFAFPRGIVLPPKDGRFLIVGHYAIEEWDAATLKKLRDVPITKENQMYMSAVARAAAAPCLAVVARKTPGLLAGFFSSKNSLNDEILLVDMRGNNWKASPVTKQPDLVDIAMTPDGREIIGSTSSKGIFIWSAADGKLIRQIPIEGTTTKQVELSPDGQTLIVTREGSPKKDDASVLLFDYESGQLKKTIDDLQLQYPRVSFSPDGKLLAIGCRNAIALHDQGTGKVRRLNFDSPSESKELVGAWTITFSQDGSKLAAFVLGSGLNVWSLKNDPGLKPIVTFTALPNLIMFMQNGALTLGLGPNFYTIDTTSGRFLNGSPTHSHEIVDVAFGPADRRIWTIDRESLCKWDAKSFSCDQMTEHGFGLAFINVPTNSLIREDMGGLSSIDLATRKTKKISIEGFMHNASLSPDGKSILVPSKNHRAWNVWNLEDGKLLLTFPRDSSKPAFPPNGQTLIANLSREFVHCSLLTYDLRTGKSLKEWSWSKDGDLGIRTDHIAVSADGRRVWLLQDFGRSLQVVDVDSGVSVLSWAMKDEIKGVDGMILSPDGLWFAIARSDKENDYLVRVEIFDAITGKTMATWTTEAKFSINMVFSPDSSSLVTSGKSALVWDVARLRPSSKNNTLDFGTRVKLWADLSSDPKTAFQAIQAWVDSPDAAIDHFQQVLKPIPRGPVTNEITKLLDQLDSQKFNERDAAERQLTEKGLAVQGALTKFIEDSPSVEAKRRAQRILDQSDKTNKALDRALETLERIGNPAARELLVKLAAGEPTARLTIDAQAGVERIDRRKW